MSVSVNVTTLRIHYFVLMRVLKSKNELEKCFKTCLQQIIGEFSLMKVKCSFEDLPFRGDVVRNWKPQNFLQKVTNLNQLSI